MQTGKKRRGRVIPRREQGQFRIIGGDWRRRRLDFPAHPGVRPTGDRVRETLFNWLQAEIHGARCLDLFAGSGALGLEALSRGAAEVTFVDRSAALLSAIGAHLRTLDDAGRGRCVVADARAFLMREAQPFDIVFLDPPFDGDLLGPAAAALADGLLAPGARIYLEHGASQALPPLPPGWVVARDARAGNVRYHLAVADPAPDD